MFEHNRTYAINMSYKIRVYWSNGINNQSLFDMLCTYFVFVIVRVERN